MNECSVLNDDNDQTIDKEKTFYHEDFIDSDNENMPEYLDRNNLNNGYSSGGEYLENEEIDPNNQLLTNGTENKNKSTESNGQATLVMQTHSSLEENAKPYKLETIKESVTELMQANIKKLHLNEKATQNNIQNKKPASNSRGLNAIKPPVDNLKKETTRKMSNESPASAKANKCANRNNAKNMPINKSTSNLNGITTR